ncbi:MAG: segregation/condensation protein A [Patescibacteria group bacterium]
MAYELSLEYYKGPLDKLLDFIEEKKLEVSTLSLVAVTSDFLAYLEKLKKGETQSQVPAELLADFLVIASRLLLLKSKALLPSLTLSEEEEGEIKDLEMRLKIYQEIKSSQIHIKENWRESPQMLSREFLMNRAVIFYPPKKVGQPEILKSFQAILGELEQVFKPVATIKNEIINLKKKIEEIIGRLTATPLKFTDLPTGKGRNELIVLFLAVLHLIKDQLIVADQEDGFSEITIALRPFDKTQGKQAQDNHESH